MLGIQKLLGRRLAALFGKRPLSKNAERRLAHSVTYRDEPERCADGRERPVRRTRMLMRRLDRSKYNGDGTRRSAWRF